MNYDPSNDMAAPDLSHLTEEERKIIEEVMKRQKAEENSEKKMREQNEKELKEIEKLIEERKTSILRIQATLDPALCQICQKTKFADGIGRKCVHCQLKVCVRCSRCLKLKNKHVSWACQLCSKRQELLSKSGIWFQNRRQSPTDHPPLPSHKSLQPSPATNTPPASSPVAATPSVEASPAKKLDRKYSTDWAKSLKEPHQCYENDRRHATPTDTKKKMPGESGTRASSVPLVEPEKIRTDGNVASKLIDDQAQDVAAIILKEVTGDPRTEVPISQEQNHATLSSETVKFLGNGPLSSTLPRLPSPKQSDTMSVKNEKLRVPSRDNNAPVSDSKEDERQMSEPVNIPSKNHALANGPIKKPLPSTENENNKNDNDKQRVESTECRKQQQGAPKRALFQKKSLNDCSFHQAFLKHEEKRAEKSYCQRVINNNSSSSSSLEDEHLYRRTKVDQPRKKSDPKGRKEQVIHRKSDTLSERTDSKNEQIYSTSWKMNHQKTKFVGRIYLRRSKNGSLGLKVVGGRRNKDGTLGAYVTKVMPGSPADYVGQLKTGDEVIEWNGRYLKNLSFEAVCEIVKESQHIDCIKIIASRSIKPQVSSHIQAIDTEMLLPEELSTPQKLPAISSAGPSSSCSGQIFGKIQALIDLSYPEVYANHQWYLMVDMSEDSPLRIMSKNRSALYTQYGITHRPYSAACDSFSLYESAERVADNRPRSSCISDLPHISHYQDLRTRSITAEAGESFVDNVCRHPAWHYAKNRYQQNYPSNNRLSSYDMIPTVQTLPDSLNYSSPLPYNNDRHQTATIKLKSRPSVDSSSFYLTDNVEIMQNRAKSNRIAEADYSDVYICTSNNENDKIFRKASSGGTRRSLKKHQSLHDRNRQIDQQSSTAEPLYGDTTLQVRVNGANNELSGDCRPNCSPGVNSPRIENAIGGYQSDESEISGTNLTPKKPNRAPKLRHFKSENGQSQTLTSVDDRSETETSNAETTIDLTLPGDTIPVKMQQKKKLMNRLVPNKIVGRHLFEQKKMTSFSRSEEVRTPSQLQAQASLIQQLSVDSTGSISSDSTAKAHFRIPLNVATDPSLTAFLSTLGPGQVVGRQVLASPCLGEIQLILFVRNNKLEIKILKCRHLVKKTGAKYNPAPFVKLYLMDGKRCVAKAKSSTAARIAEPHFDQHLIFDESPKGRYLQLSLWGDYGRMERKCFMGIALLKLDHIDLTAPVEGWYKLYHTNSLIGLSSRADSDASTIRVSQEIDKII